MLHSHSHDHGDGGGGCCGCLEWIGTLAILYLTIRTLNAIYDVLYPFFVSKPPADLVGYSGASWAGPFFGDFVEVITGSTDGIGKQYAIQLAQKGFNVAIIGRNQQKLQQTSEEINALAPSIDIKQIVFDFADSDVESYQENMENRLKELDVGVLVNNVGTSQDGMEMFHLVENDEVIRNITVVNTLSLVMMTRFVIHKMLKRNKGIIVNVGSGTYMHPFAMLSTYAATKSFVDAFTRGLQHEYANTKLFIQVVHPFFVATKMSKMRRTSLFVPGPEQYVRSALNTIGVQPITYGCASHAAQAVILSCLLFVLPDSIANKLVLYSGQKMKAAAIKAEARRLERNKDK